MKSDFVVDLAFGDCGKGKITHQLLQKTTYTHCVRFSGGDNAGHTIFHKGEKLVTHLIPAGIFFNVRSVIGPGCVLNVKSFFKELEYLEKNGISASSLVKVSNITHIVTEDHIREETSESAVGTTRRGIGPCHRDKAARIGIRAESIPELKPFLVDFYDDLHSSDSTVLFEGAQGFYLDPHFGDYPFVTSSHCTVAAALTNGVSHKSIRKVYGAIKAYETYVGAKQFEGDDPIFKRMREVGNEFGATTGRPRQCNFVNFDGLKKAVDVNGVTDLVINKMDVMKELNCWKIRYNDGLVIDLFTEEEFKNYFLNIFPDVNIIFSYSPEAL